MLLVSAEGAMWCSDQPALSSSLRNLNSAANSGKNHKDILKKHVGHVLLRADKTWFLLKKKKKIVRMKMFLTDKVGVGVMQDFFSLCRTLCRVLNASFLLEQFLY